MTNDDQKDVARDVCVRALRQVCLSLPHLAGLVHKVRFEIDGRIPTAAIFASGRMLVNADFALSLKHTELVFVLAHEVMHLALDTHSRGVGADPLEVNVAHDYIINDILADELGQEIPAGGLEMPGARHHALEDVLSWGHRFSQQGAWRSNQETPALSPLGEALVEAGLADRPEESGTTLLGDVLSSEVERQLFPDASVEEIARRVGEIREESAKANSLEIARQTIEQATQQKQQGTSTGEWTQTIEALRTSYQPPWQLALQRWFDSGAPQERTYARPSRRGADRTDIALPGRRREGRTMHIVLDTSGSMAEDLASALGAIGSFCEANNVEDVHILQCDESVTVDEWVAASELETYEIKGFGGSDMSPAMDLLAEDGSVEAAIVITDGFIYYPDKPTPYSVLWAIVSDWYSDFEPDYGVVVVMPPAEIDNQ